MVMRKLMFQGTGSDVGKSLLVAGLCRAYRRRGLKVAPFKPQNMSNNAAVTQDGGEIGRAQALQARAAGLAPSVHMNPVLLKPQSETGSQIIVAGRVFGTARAAEFQTLKPQLLAAVMASFDTLSAEADLMLIEGAGSASEINLRANDIANMGFARNAGCPVVLIGDIDRGGVIAQIAGTKLVLDPQDAALVQGFIVNKFRGDRSLFAEGMVAIARHTGWRGLGIVPYFHAARYLPAEDSMALERPAEPHEPADGKPLTIAVPVLPHIANFDDLDPLANEPNVRLLMLKPGTPLPVDCDLVLLPGSKATIADLKAMREAGWDIDIKAHARRGGRVFGLCGGYQMLGHRVDDPQGVEGAPDAIEGLGLLDVETLMTAEKTLTNVAGRSAEAGVPFSGFEMHMGRTQGRDCAKPLLIFADGHTDGAVSPDGHIAGTYVHGFFNDDAQRKHLIESLGGRSSSFSYDAKIEEVLDGLAAHLETHLDLDLLLSLAG
ncbi:Cobyric acid synthase [Methylovirgula sp. HY1]|nr:Cobyric acid synthase [Methylovirgula sp. HY1]